MAAKEKPKPLSPKQRAFVEAYLKCWNASEAARQAGYKGQANVVGPRLLANVSIAAAIEARLAELKMGSDEVLVRLAEQARFDPLRFVTFSETGLARIDLVALREAGLGALVKKIGYDKWGNQVVEFHDAQAAQRLIGQHHKLFTQRHEVELPQLAPLPDVLKDLIGQVYGAANNENGGDNPAS
jgi:hypothetical protein